MHGAPNVIKKVGIGEKNKESKWGKKTKRVCGCFKHANKREGMRTWLTTPGEEGKGKKGLSTDRKGYQGRGKKKLGIVKLKNQGRSKGNPHKGEGRMSRVTHHALRNTSRGRGTGKPGKRKSVTRGKGQCNVAST